jgi:hypothetical protein
MKITVERGSDEPGAYGIIDKFENEIPDWFNSSHCVVTYGEGDYAEKYTGAIKNGDRNGDAIFVNDDGHTYQGPWKDDQMHGKFILTTFTGNATFIEEWDSGKCISSFALPLRGSEVNFNDRDNATSSSSDEAQLSDLSEDDDQTQSKPFIYDLLKKVAPQASIRVTTHKPSGLPPLAPSRGASNNL